MGFDGNGQRFCDECGRNMLVAVRIHQGAEYCRACYVKVFVKAKCPVCEGSMRRHRHAPENTPCSDCARADRVCLRCRRLTPRAARIVDGQAVCGRCVPHFNDVTPCDRCGKPSRQLFTSLLGQAEGRTDYVDADGGERERICQPCRTKPTHATCSVCRRYRKACGSSPQGRPLCNQCAKPAPATHLCPVCGEQTPGGGAARCFECVQRDAAARCAKMLGASLEQVWCRELWLGFTDTLIGDAQRLSKAKKLIEAAVEYFRLLEGNFSVRNAITSASLHQVIDSPVHRRHLLAYRFLVDTLELRDTVEDRGTANEDRRLADILMRCSDLPSNELLRDYVEHLRADSVSQRTVRLYAGVAQRFCESANADSIHGWPEGAVVRFLQHTPGAANSLSKFVTYCRRVHGWESFMPSKAAIRNSPGHAKRSVDRMRRALSRVQGRPAQELKLLEVSRIIAAATGLPLRQLANAEGTNVCREGAKTIVLATDAHIEPGHPLHPFAIRWAALIASRAALTGMDGE